MSSTGEIVSFGDNTAVVCAGSNWKNVKKIKPKNICLIKNFFDARLFTINFAKNKYIFLLYIEETE